MIKKYPWHVVFLIFVILCLSNIFQKLQWTAPTDNHLWQQSEQGLVCIETPKDSLIKENDVLLTVDSYIIKTQMDLERIIRSISKRKKSLFFSVERDGILTRVVVSIGTRYTPFTYFILAFSGILLLLLTLSILNTGLKKRSNFTPPAVFYLMSMAFSGLLIFSPTGSYNTSDFIFLVLDRISFIFFPALMLHFSLYYPIKLKILRFRVLRPKFLKFIIYLTPSVILMLKAFFIFSSMIDPDTGVLLSSINHFRRISLNYFNVYLLLALSSFISSNLWLILKRSEKKYIFPLIGVTVSITAMLVLNLLVTAAERATFIGAFLGPFLPVFLPLGLTYYMGHRKFTDIENIIKRTVSIASIFLFIFGIFFVLGSTIEQNKILGIFWSVATILTAGLVFRPIEESVHKSFERFFFRGAADFKKKLTELIQSFRNERNLSIIATNFLNTINNGFQLQKSTFIILHRKNIFFALPQKKKLLLSNGFRKDLFANESLTLFSSAEFERRYPKDHKMMKDMNYFQFLPLKTQDKLIGLVAFGPKMDNTYLSVEDWEIMYQIASPLTLSVENAALYSELENQFNEISLLKEFNENIIENINVGIVALTQLNIIKTWNDFMALKFRIPSSKAIGTKAHVTFGRKLWKQIFKNKKKASVSFLRNVNVEIGEEEFIFDIHISPLKNSQGRIMGTILVFEDMTEKLTMQSQLITSEKMASLGLLSAGIAHEINTPLTGISSYCQFILDNPEDPENIDLTTKIQEQVLRANRIVRTLLDFSRQKGEAPTELDLNNVISESIALMEHTLKKKNISLQKDFCFKRRLFGFSTRLQQLFINLLINASDAITNSSGIINISGLETNADVIIRIKDNGDGISPRHLEKIFDPFFTTKDKGKGTGLGLSITYNIVQEHYGEISVNSKLDKGTTFIVTLPITSPLRSIKL